MSELSQRKGIMLCYPFEESRLHGMRTAWDADYFFLQPKLDGERCRALQHNGCTFLLSSSEELILTVPHILSAMKMWMKKLEKELGHFPEFDGELYKHGWKFEKIHGAISSRVNKNFDSDSIEYHIFDIVDEKLSQEDRLILLDEIFDYFPPPSLSIKKVKHEFGIKVETVWEWLNTFMLEGYEGIITRNPSGLYVRKRSSDIMKFKPAQSDTFIIRDFIEEEDVEGKPKGRLGRLILDSKDGETTFKVYSGFSDSEREALWKTRDLLVGKEAVIEYQCITGKNKVPRSGRFKVMVNSNG